MLNRLNRLSRVFAHSYITARPLATMTTPLRIGTHKSVLPSLLQLYVY